MRIQYPPIVSLDADLESAKLVLGKVVVSARIKGKTATLTLEKDEARMLAASIQSALIPARVKLPDAEA